MKQEVIISFVVCPLCLRLELKAKSVTLLKFWVPKLPLIRVHLLSTISQT